MRYIDTGNRDPAQALGAWLHGFTAANVRSLRLQSGYFNIDGLAPLAQVLDHMAARDLQVSCVVGSNGAETTGRDIDVLVDLMGFPRPNARIAVVSYTAGLYHPKVYHVTRADGSQTAYVGSANLTSPGVTGLNVEAGVILDTAAGDDGEPLEEIAAAVDAWFGRTSPAVQILRTRDDIAELVAIGILGVASAQSQRRCSTADTVAAEGVRLTQLLSFPSLGASAQTASYPTAAEPTQVPGIAVPTRENLPARTSHGAPPAVPRSGFPDYVLFAPGASVPTRAADALTGLSLPSGAAGLIVRLNRDSARHFAGSSGTANVSIPIAAVSTLRFGIYQHQHERPRAEFPLTVRYAYTTQLWHAPSADTNVMVYGHAPNESGHGDIRLLVPTAPVRAVRDFAQQHNLRIPAAGDPMMLEWPTSDDPRFTATFADTNSPLYELLQTEYQSAEDRAELVGGGACWLPAGVAASIRDANVL